MNVQYLETHQHWKMSSIKVFSGGTTWLQEKHPVCTNSKLSSVQAFIGPRHAAFGNHHLTPENRDTSVTAGNTPELNEQAIEKKPWVKWAS